MVGVLIHQNEVAALVRHHFLAEEQRQDADAISDALGALLDHVLNVRTKGA
jgi:hypothetical protein